MRWRNSLKYLDGDMPQVQVFYRPPRTATASCPQLLAWVRTCSLPLRLLDATLRSISQVNRRRFLPRSSARTSRHRTHATGPGEVLYRSYSSRAGRVRGQQPGWLLHNDCIFHPHSLAKQLPSGAKNSHTPLPPSPAYWPLFAPDGHTAFPYESVISRPRSFANARHTLTSHATPSPSPHVLPPPSRHILPPPSRHILPPPSRHILPPPSRHILPPPSPHVLPSQARLLAFRAVSGAIFCR
jgi:hypothetical protein